MSEQTALRHFQKLPGGLLCIPLNVRRLTDLLGNQYTDECLSKATNRWMLKVFSNISELFCFCMQMFGCDCHSFYYFVEVTFSLMFFKIDFFDFRFCNRSFSANGYILITVVNNCGKFGYHGFVTMGFGLICCKTNFRNGSRP